MTKAIFFCLSLCLVSFLSLVDTRACLTATGGITGFEGTVGGGITPWAFISGYGSREEINGTANVQYLHLNDYTLTTFGASLGIYDRVELSVQRQSLDISCGITSNGFSLSETIYL